MKIFDTHTHDYFPSFDDNRDKMLEKCRNSGVIGKVQVGCDVKSSLQALHLAEKNENMWSTLGVHPCETQKYYSQISNIFETFQKIFDKDQKKQKKIVAVGEIGFDFFHHDSPEIRAVQEEFFLEHLRFAYKNSLPVVIHSRGAKKQTISFLRRNFSLLRRSEKKSIGVFHCFSENSEMAKILTEEFGFFLGIGGTSTYKKNTEIRDAIKNTDIQFLVTETDSPFLAPQKYRGKQNNSSYISEVIELISEIKKISIEECAEILIQNARKLFDI